MEKEYYGCVYITTNMINGKKYVGQSVSPNEVFYGRYKGSGKVIKQAFSKYGYNNFKCEIIEYIEDDTNLITKEERLQLQDKLDERETFWIEKNETLIPNGYNLKLGGQRGGKHHEESKKKISNYNKNKSKKHREKLRISMLGENNHFYKKTHTTDVKDLISLCISERNKNRRWINKDGENKYVDIKDLKEYLFSGWKCGMIGHKLDTIEKISKSVKSALSTKDYKQKRRLIASGRSWITKNGNTKFIVKDKIPSYISEGWKLGRN